MPRLSAKTKHSLIPAESADFPDAPGAEPVAATAKPTKPVIERPAPYIPRARLPDDASETTRAVLSYLHGPVYALDRKPHLAQHVATSGKLTDPAKIASTILTAIMEALEPQTQKWTGSPGVSAWARDKRPAPAGGRAWVGHVQLPKTFPERRACVVWDDDGCGLAGRDLCVEFCLVENAAGAVTGFSYRYDLIGPAYAVPVVATADLPPPPAPTPAPGSAKSAPTSAPAPATP